MRISRFPPQVAESTFAYRLRPPVARIPPRETIGRRSIIEAKGCFWDTRLPSLEEHRSLGSYPQFSDRTRRGTEDHQATLSIIRFKLDRNVPVRTSALSIDRQDTNVIAPPINSQLMRFSRFSRSVSACGSRPREPRRDFRREFLSWPGTAVTRAGLDHEEHHGSPESRLKQRWCSETETGRRGEPRRTREACAHEPPRVLSPSRNVILPLAPRVSVLLARFIAQVSPLCPDR